MINRVLAIEISLTRAPEQLENPHSRFYSKLYKLLPTERERETLQKVSIILRLILHADNKMNFYLEAILSFFRALVGVRLRLSGIKNDFENIFEN